MQKPYLDAYALESPLEGGSGALQGEGCITVLKLKESKAI